VFVYILHFDDPLSHAQHYVGMTGNLRQRLEAHAAGSGARLTRVLTDRDKPWSLGGLFQTTSTNARRVEKELKDTKNVMRFCDICNKDAPAPPGAKRYPLNDVPFPKRSDELAPEQFSDVRIQIREGRDQLDIDYTRLLQRVHKVELGFLNETALWTAVTEQHCHIATLNGRAAGFIIWTYHESRKEVTIHQCCVEDWARLRGIGRHMILALAALNPTSSIWCKVRNDLPANFFWEAIGFKKVRTVIHKSSTQQLNQYHKKSIR
jgi:predicted GIY-YIG superfamily endonuclease